MEKHSKKIKNLFYSMLKNDVLTDMCLNLVEKISNITSYNIKKYKKIKVKNHRIVNEEEKIMIDLKPFHSTFYLKKEDKYGFNFAYIKDSINKIIITSNIKLVSLEGKEYIIDFYSLDFIKIKGNKLFIKIYKNY